MGCRFECMIRLKSWRGTQHTLTIVSLWVVSLCLVFFFFSSRRRHTRLQGDWSSDVCSSDLPDAHESFEGAMVVKTLGRQDAEVERLGEAADLLRVARVRVGALRALFEPTRSEERRVGKECRSRWSPYH